MAFEGVSIDIMHNVLIVNKRTNSEDFITAKVLNF